jgi:hypothetical protein
LDHEPPATTFVPTDLACENVRSKIQDKHPTSLEQAADELRRGLQRGRVEVVSRLDYPPDADRTHEGQSRDADSLDRPDDAERLVYPHYRIR